MLNAFNSFWFIQTRAFNVQNVFKVKVIFFSIIDINIVSVISLLNVVTVRKLERGFFL